MSQKKDKKGLPPSYLFSLASFWGGRGFWGPSKMDQTAWRIFLDKKRSYRWPCPTMAFSGNTFLLVRKNVIVFCQKKHPTIFIRFHHVNQFSKKTINLKKKASKKKPPLSTQPNPPQKKTASPACASPDNEPTLLVFFQGDHWYLDHIFKHLRGGQSRDLEMSVFGVFCTCSRQWFQIFFIFTPTLGKWSQFD